MGSKPADATYIKWQDLINADQHNGMWEDWKPK